MESQIIAMYLEGFIYLLVSQAVFIVCGFVTNFVLARYFGPELYGTYSVVLSLLTWVQLFVMSGVPFALQKYIAEQTEKAYSIKKNGYEDSDCKDMRGDF